MVQDQPERSGARSTVKSAAAFYEVDLISPIPRRPKKQNGVLELRIERKCFHERGSTKYLTPSSLDLVLPQQRSTTCENVCSKLTLSLIEKYSFRPLIPRPRQFHLEIDNLFDLKPEEVGGSCLIVDSRSSASKQSFSQR